MALKPTIYKFTLSLSDLNHDFYTNINLTVAKHPSETLERMMARVLAFCIHAHQDSDGRMVFTKGLSSVDEPDIWIKSLDDQIQLWLDVGEPSYERMKKATRQAKQTLVYCFNSKADVWWQQSQAKLSGLNLQVLQFNWADIQGVTALLERTVTLSVCISGDAAFIAGEENEREVNWQCLQDAK